MNETDIDNEDFTLRLALNKQLKLIKKWPIFIILQNLIFKPQQLNRTLPLFWSLVTAITSSAIIIEK